ncbi:DUF4232 domain-containing protein [Streptomyces cinnamoneus]|uniref:DUF4232 domain-containing protein n=1 Tax=Streptomyces cinnamoneus TaxID=53446 RepID=UPI0034309D48
MRSPLLTVPALMAGILLLTACGSERTGSRSDASPHESPCGAQPSGTATASDGVRITGASRGAGGCAAEFEVTNHEAEPFTYTITFTFLSGAGEALASQKETVPSVGPGRTVKRTVTMSGTGALPSGTRAPARVQIAGVRSVPTAEAPTPGGSCPPSGVRVYADDGDAAMGLRVAGIHLENCGTATTRLDGYPQLQVLDKARKPVDGVEVLQGGSSIATGTGADGVPRPLALAPGERAYATLVWRNTVEGGAPVNAPYVRVRATPGAAPVTVTPELDLGTTGKLGVGPWKKDETSAPGTGGSTSSGTRSPERPPARP